MSIQKVTKDVIEYMEYLYPFLVDHADYVAELVIEQIPIAERMIVESFELLFAPRHVLRQLILSVIVSGLIMGGKMMGNLGNAMVVYFSKAERDQKEVLQQLSKAKSYVEWRQLAERLDFMRGNDRWRMRDKSSLYDFQVHGAPVLFLLGIVQSVF